jgi:nucleotide-binding universal stress UspA family protein
MAKTWLVGFDFSDCSQRALDLAAAELAAQDAHILIVHAHTTGDLPAGEGEDESGANAAQHAQGYDLATRLEEVAREMRKQHEGIEFETVLRREVASKAIVATAEERDVERIVLATRGHSAVGQMFVGSTANRVIQSAKVPTLVVPCAE